MTTLSESNHIPGEDRQPGTWSASFLAGLPHLLMGLLIGLGKFSVFDGSQSSLAALLVIGVALGLLVTAMLTFAGRRGWPLWSASWYLYGTWVTLAIIGAFIAVLDLEASWRYTNALFVGWVLLCITGYFVILTKSTLHGLLSVAFFFPLLGVLLLEFIPDPIEGWLAIGLGLLMSLTAGVIVRLGAFRPGLGFVLGINAIAGLALAYVGEYQIKDLPSNAPAHMPTFSSFLVHLARFSIIALGMIAVPFLLRGLWNFGKRKLA